MRAAQGATRPRVRREKEACSQIGSKKSLGGPASGHAMPRASVAGRQVGCTTRAAVRAEGQDLCTKVVEGLVAYPAVIRNQQHGRRILVSRHSCRVASCLWRTPTLPRARARHAHAPYRLRLPSCECVCVCALGVPIAEAEAEIPEELQRSGAWGVRRATRRRRGQGGRR